MWPLQPGRRGGHKRGGPLWNNSKSPSSLQGKTITLLLVCHTTVTANTVSYAKEKLQQENLFWLISRCTMQYKLAWNAINLIQLCTKSGTLPIWGEVDSQDGLQVTFQEHYTAPCSEIPDPAITVHTSENIDRKTLPWIQWSQHNYTAVLLINAREMGATELPKSLKSDLGLCSINLWYPYTSLGQKTSAVNRT